MVLARPFPIADKFRIFIRSSFSAPLYMNVYPLRHALVNGASNHREGIDGKHEHQVAQPL